MSPLHYAAEYGHLGIVKHLLSQKAAINETDCFIDVLSLNKLHYIMHLLIIIRELLSFWFITMLKHMYLIIG